MSVSRHHADWLNLVEHSGPFFSLPVLSRVFSNGLDPRDSAQAKRLREAYEHWQDNPAAPGKQYTWVMHVLTELLGYPEKLIAESQAIPAGLEARMAEMGETLRPDIALLTPNGREGAGQAQMLISVYPPEQQLDKPVVGKHWKATPATRMMELLHGAGIPLGLATNGEQWMLVYAPRGETTGYASWYASLWLDEPITLRAFHSLLGTHRFFGVADANTPLGMLKESANDQQEVTDQLGYQVREAVEVLVQSFDALDKESGRKLLHGVAEPALYNAALTVMMRLVFLFSAEERGMLQLGKPLYDDNYAVSTLQELLQEVADRFGEEVLERRTDAWARLLASFRSLHGGVHHQDLSMPSYGGSLFDPDRYPFLEGRADGTSWRNSVAEPLAINNRVVLHLLNALQRLRIKGAAAGGMAETRRVSFRALGVEQIGHVYEGLLDHTAISANEPVLGLKGTSKKEPEVALTTLEGLLAQGENKLIAFLKEETGRSPAALKKLLTGNSLLDEHKLLVACGQDQDLLGRVRPFACLVREDSFERPLVVLPRSFYVTASTTRRSTGTHYTPPSLTEPIVRHTLEPLVYEGPPEGLPREQWKLKSPKEILELKVCDMAMGSGAFLVQVCRYLAERLVEAWESEEREHPDEVLVTPEGGFSKGKGTERLIPGDPGERLAIARRVVADRCLYGVDINPMAVEMAKLSMWLITMDPKRPFSFLDHAFKCGDSLMGITSTDELDWFYIDSHSGQQRLGGCAGLVSELAALRLQLEALPSETSIDIEHKSALLEEAHARAWQLHILADILGAARLYHPKAKARKAYLETAALSDIASLEADAKQLLAHHRPMHWALEFPEVISLGGFHAFVGNPPFVGGKKISGALGTDYREFLVDCVANGAKGNADLCSYFFLQAGRLLRRDGVAGLLATNTIAQGDTREVGLDQLLADGFTIPRAVPSATWPGVAALEVAHVWLRKGDWKGDYILDDATAPGITALLTAPGRVTGNPFRLKTHENSSFQGSIVLGMGFVLSQDEAISLIERNPKNRDCLFTYLNGDDLNSRTDQSPSRWVINFHDWPLNRLGTGHWLAASEKQQKEWLRSGIVPGDYPGSVAADYPELLAIVEERVKPERTRKNEKDDYQLRYPLYLKWWIYADKRPELYATIAKMGRYLVHPLTSKHHNLVFYKPGQVASHMTVVLAIDSWADYAVIQSEPHWKWALAYGNKLENRPQYTPTDCFETFPFPIAQDGLGSIGERYYVHRQSIMQSREEGLTQTYNRFHNPAETGSDVIDLRRLQVEMDQAVVAAYGWKDLNLSHCFHETKQGIRYTISEDARREILDRLLELNHQRHAEEVAAGLHEKKRVKVVSSVKQGRKPFKVEHTQADLFS